MNTVRKVAFFPAKIKTSVNNPDYKPITGSAGYLSYLQESPYMEVERIDIGTTALRALAVAAVTAVAFAITGGTKKADRAE